MEQQIAKAGAIPVAEWSTSDDLQLEPDMDAMGVLKMKIEHSTEEFEAKVGAHQIEPQPYDPERFRSVALLQVAPRNQGHVELLEDLHWQEHVAAKVMPTSWTCRSHQEFSRTYPNEVESPWRDIAVTRYLRGKIGHGVVCDVLGLFRRTSEPTQQAARGFPSFYSTAMSQQDDEPPAGEESLCFALTYCAGADLFTWLGRSLANKPGVSREAAVKPLAYKLLQNLQMLHSVGVVAHGDLSLENILMMNAQETDGGSTDLRFIDFGMASGPVASCRRGKICYQAPEMHTDQFYDAFAADVFSAGIGILTLVIGNYPWKTSRPMGCQFFSYFRQHGLMAFLAKRKMKSPSGEIMALSQALSPDFVSLLEGMLWLEPSYRFSAEAALRHPWFKDGCC
eukprot:TRINITY_DN6096_c0_g2_i4.p1 TRINITY_DN6096_c0_g2~~TRINITY_DN6096_c0_g2_i4.p1  ORF type:complete len:395 (+),score=48.10 TRINITY_DN6096_c0_g2_i4:74-1258(+)